MKNLLFTTIIVIAISNSILRGQNCNLINSATFTVPNDSTEIFTGHFVNVYDTLVLNPMPLVNQQWHYFAITSDASKHAKIYENGQLVFEGNYASLSYSWNRLDLGATFYTTYMEWFNGWVDEIKISNTVLTTQTILNNYTANIPFTSDANTIGLWHFDQSTGTVINSTTGTTGSITNAQWDASGKFGSCLYYNGTNARATIPMAIPTSNMTFEFWIKPNTIKSCWPISFYGANTSGFSIEADTLPSNYTWSTGATGNSITVNPQALPYIWVTNGQCTDTIFFSSQSATVYDTVTTYISVTDTLIINANVGISPLININSIKIFPNPANDHITINFGNYSSMSGYTLKIANSLGTQVYTTPINQQSSYIDLNNFGGMGTYFVTLIDSQSNIVVIRKIILQ
jgi:hypothetical protein